MRRTMFAFLFAILVLRAMPAIGQTVQFTHHGDIGFAANENGYDLQLVLFDKPTVGTGTQQGAAFQHFGVQMTDGEFTVQLDFRAAVFTGAEIYLETGWRVSGGGAFTVLPNREKITAVYANRSLSAATADSATNSTQLGGLPPTSFIQNTSSQQSGSFHVSGDGTAGGTLSAETVNASAQYSIAGRRVLSMNGPYDDGSGLFVFNASNTFAGDATGLNTTPSPSLNNPVGKFNSFFGAGAGQANTNGAYNSFLGAGAGRTNTIGADNTFVGALAGYYNIAGSNNTFVGNQSGLKNTSGNNNSFFGNGSGRLTTTGENNSFFGFNVAYSNQTGADNSFFGSGAGWENTIGIKNCFFGSSAGSTTSSGSNNIFVGYFAGVGNKTGSGNLFFGTNAGQANIGGNDNIVIGNAANLSANGLTNASAIGAHSSVGQSNSLILGSINGVNAATADTKVGIGTIAPGYRLHVVDPLSAGLRVQTNGAGGAVASFGGNGDFLIDAPYISGGRLIVKENGFIGIGNNAPNDKLDVSGSIRLSQLGSGGGQSLCRNSANQISACSSSLRYKTNVASFKGGLDLVNRLQPITFNWKANGEADLGLGAEDVANIEPLLVTHNEKGEIEGVKYDRVGVVLINALKEQQAQLEEYHSQLSQQQAEIAALKRLICAGQPDAELCKELPPTNRK